MATSSVAVDPLLIIYGDNGSGKTTLLELTFFLLSTVDNAGHKSKVARIKFNRFAILLQGGIEIIAERENDLLIGSYTLIIKENGNEINKVVLEANNENSIRVQEGDESIIKEYYEIIKYIKKLNISIHYLSDNRKLLSSDNDILDIDARIKRNHLSRHERELAIREERALEDGGDLVLAVKKLENWIKRHVLQASKTGDKNTNTIYTDLIKRVTGHNGKLSTEKEVLSLVEDLIEIRNENVAYYKNGLVSKIETKEIEDTLKDTKNYNLTLIYNVLEPYVNGLRGRLDSLKEIQETIELFVKRINGYFSNKSIKYNLVTGFDITNKELKEPIELKMLSSGEKQLFLLFCNVITSSEVASIFIIDEPEISLNIKWQRKLIQTLLDFSRSNNVQFIFASHSIELLTGHKDSVSKLKHCNELPHGG